METEASAPVVTETRYVDTHLERAVDTAFAKVRNATHYDDEQQAKAELTTYLMAHYVRR